MGKEMANQVQEVQRVPYRINPRRNTPRHILIKLTKTKHKERILKAAREKQQVTHKGNPIRLTADLSAETVQARREWHNVFKVLCREPPREIPPMTKVMRRGPGRQRQNRTRGTLWTCSSIDPETKTCLSTVYYIMPFTNSSDIYRGLSPTTFL